MPQGPGSSNVGNVFPLRNPETRDNARDQRRALNRTRHLKVQQPLPNHNLDGGDFGLPDRGVYEHHLVDAHGPNILPWKESDGEPLVPQSDSGMQNIITPRC